MAYAADFNSMNRQIAGVIDKVLRGRKPADLPVEFATTFRLSINAKAANRIGLALSPHLLARADDVIE